jgi:hypothetical protein
MAPDGVNADPGLYGSGQEPPFIQPSVSQDPVVIVITPKANYQNSGPADAYHATHEAYDLLQTTPCHQKLISEVRQTNFCDANSSDRNSAPQGTLNTTTCAPPKNVTAPSSKDCSMPMEGEPENVADAAAKDAHVSISLVTLDHEIQEKGKQIHEVMRLFKQATTLPLSSFVLQTPHHKNSTSVVSPPP